MRSLNEKQSQFEETLLSYGTTRERDRASKMGSFMQRVP